MFHGLQDEPGGGHDDTEQIESLSDDTQPIKEEEGANEELNAQTTSENNDRQGEDNTKDKTDEEIASLSDKPAGKDILQTQDSLNKNSENITEELIKGDSEQTSKEVGEEKSKGDDEQVNQGTAVEQIKEGDGQGSREPHEESSIDPPSKDEDETVPPEQAVDDSLQLVSDISYMPKNKTFVQNICA